MNQLQTEDGHELIHPGQAPVFDPEATGRVVKRVEIESVQLVSVLFDQENDVPLHSKDWEPEVPDYQLGTEVHWKQSEEGDRLGCLLTFGIVFEEVKSPFQLVARFRATYQIASGERLTDEDLNQFAHWNATFNVWPFWRELVLSTLGRAELPMLVVPVMRVPTPK
jgi:hypothetical protein